MPSGLTETYNSDQERESLAIIGGGSLGPIAVIELAQRVVHDDLTLKNQRLHLCDPDGFANGGIAYGLAHPNQRLNSTRDEMSPWNPGAFEAYATRITNLDETKTFEPRVLYKDFLEESYQSALETLKEAGAEIIEHRVKADISYQDPERISIINAEQNSPSPLCEVHPRNLLLTLGYGPNAKFESLKPYSQQGYIHSLYPSDTLDEEPSLHNDDNIDVVVLGSGPALYDFVNVLDKPPESVDLTVFSNSALMGVRDVTLEKNETHFTPTYLQEAGSNTSLDDLKDLVTQDFNAALQNGFTPRRASLDIINDMRTSLKRLAPQVATEYIKSQDFAHLKHKATPVPEESVTRLNSFSPQHLKAHICAEDITPQDNGRFLIATPDDMIEADLIVNATGHGRHNHPLLKNMEENGHAIFDETTQCWV
ncbi:MAG: FAD/NAD(P)-binding protein [Alcanivorax sp.]